MAADLYHERQSLQMCAKHSINNLLQKEELRVTKAELHDISRTLAGGSTWQTRHHESLIGTGNWDVNVITLMLQKRGFDMRWFDKRKDVKTIDLSTVVGFIANRTERFLLMKFAHWYTLLKHTEDDGYRWYDMDSKLNTPRVFANNETLLEHLKGVLDKNGSLFIVTVDDKDPNAGSNAGEGS